ncbi:ABC transporter ATP-binding protein [Streptacidiphilus melanogenes]|uniref:ABC transporter ATP-binding protein n=1 Tax=Streptacidiphilus melanogenes TaxID=411235 RepID=UPI000A0580B9|nr:ABC transporter ATP-binding protein [Streptacidiphilus melanogenes]
MSPPPPTAAGLPATPPAPAPHLLSDPPSDPGRDPGSEPHAVRLTGLGKSFARPGSAETPVLEGIDLTVPAGGFTCLIGASGCGKSTLLHLIAGLAEPSTGTVEVAGGHAALMFQEAALFPWLSAGRNIELALRLRGLRGRAERRAEAERLLTLVRLDGAHSRPVHELSGGMRQRVALARALAQQSSVLLMDEPFAALDAITRDVLHEELVRLWEQTGCAVVFVTHNVREAVRLGREVVLLSSRPGRIAGRWTVPVPQPRRIEDAEVAGLAAKITERLREEISRHGRA